MTLTLIRENLKYLLEFFFKFYIRYVTKIKNCSGFMRVDQILKVWSLLNPKILISQKIGGTKKIHGSNSRGTSRTQRPSSKFSLNAKFVENFEFFGKLASYPFRKVIYV
jgi:hypothetical protein